ncbi:MAG: DUF1284 domain-containing protein [Oscillospiraceae bacterium]|nr:DUF1284 domain-containing protein [Oscillospiraceae bacterium]
MSDKPVRLRPHHGMCLAYFAGEGYSNTFTVHMQQVLDALSPETPVVLTTGADTVCAVCPNNSGGVCTAQEKVMGYDKKVLDFCGLETDTPISFSDFTEQIQDRILTPGRRAAICLDCQWNDLCTSQPSRWAKNKRK